eukprot:TRINITY_DN15546_c0_g1_i1.p1 TRINITY_DN15546_c0_g1~~TRINITY_DN15546_c0_g1_i1.p1  ORF type:complete len:550 (+),score=125.28 TRINITY_DN15546_c0_g1_i1:168-1817(+)
MEVTQSNFREMLPLVKEALDRCVFAAVETELTGVEKDLARELHVLDTIEERYQRIKSSAQSFLVNQFGLSTFEWNAAEKQFEAKTFNFYIFPKPFGRIDQRFYCQASSLLFLSQNGFDFNKMVEEGIPFLTIPQEEECRARLNEQTAGKSAPPDIVRLNDYDLHFIKYVLFRISEWQRKPSPRVPLRAGPCDSFLRYHIIKEIYEKFPNVFVESTRVRGKPFIVITEATDGEIKERELKQREKLADELESTIGFRRVIELLRDSKKPLIGYNMLRDLANAYHLFYKPLPDSCDQFKASLHTLFPKLYDVRFIASNHSELDVHYARSLVDIYFMLNVSKYHDSPKIVHADNFDRYKEDESKFAHEAGFDAFMTGAAYLRMMYILNGENDLSKLADNANENRLYLTNWEASFNVSALQEIPNFDNVFYVSNIPDGSSTTSLYHIFAQFGRVQVKWINKNSAFVMVDRSRAEDAERALVDPENLFGNKPFNVVTYDQFYANLNLDPVISGSGDKEVKATDEALWSRYRHLAFFGGGVLLGALAFRVAFNGRT